MHTATYYIDLLLSGITVGSLYALIAIGYTMVYGILRLINFAHGDIFMMAGFFHGLYQRLDAYGSRYPRRASHDGGARSAH